MSNAQINVYIVDDEPSICTAYARLVRSARMQPRTFPSVEDFMRSGFTDEHACIVSDVQFPGKSGLELPVLLGRAGTPDEVAGVIAFLASPDASFLTGETIEINGGMNMR